jgi:hypothetical protein
MAHFVQVHRYALFQLLLALRRPLPVFHQLLPLVSRPPHTFSRHTRCREKLAGSTLTIMSCACCTPAIFSSLVLAVVPALVLAPCLTPGCPPWSRGEPKKWYGVPGSCAAEFEEVRSTRALLPHRRLSPPPLECINCALLCRPVCLWPRVLFAVASPRRALLALLGGLSPVRWWGGR